MTPSLASKVGLRENHRAILVHAPDGMADTLAGPGVAFTKALRGAFDHIVAFVTSQAQMDKRFPSLKSHLAPGGALWVAWPKARQMETDLRLPAVIEIGYRHGLVESKTISLGATWSAIKFTHPKAGKVYRNRFGTLPTA